GRRGVAHAGDDFVVRRGLRLGAGRDGRPRRRLLLGRMVHGLMHGPWRAVIAATATTPAPAPSAAAIAVAIVTLDALDLHRLRRRHAEQAAVRQPTERD